MVARDWLVLTIAVRVMFPDSMNAVRKVGGGYYWRRA
jgi:hypothetical protein